MLTIKDLSASKELDRAAMGAVCRWRRRPELRAEQLLE